MHKQKRLHYAVIGVLGFALLFMAIGFAAYAQLLNNDAFAKKPLLSSMYFSLFIDASQNCIENILILLYEYIV